MLNAEKHKNELRTLNNIKELEEEARCDGSF